MIGRALDRFVAMPWWAHALVSGLITGLSQPIVIESLHGKEPIDPSGITGLLALVGLVPALVALERDGGAGPKRAYQVGFVACLVAFSIIVHWIVTTVHVYGGLPLLVALPVLLLLTGAMAAYIAAAFAITRIIARFFSWPSWLVFPAALAATEYLRNHGPVGGFPWGSIGHAFATIDVLRQSASLVGVTGLTFIAGLVNAAIAYAIVHRSSARRPLMVAAVTLGAMVAWGALRLAHEPSGPTVKVALLQPNVNEGLASLKREPSKSILERFHRLESEALAQGAEMIIWPEGSFPGRIPRELKDLADVPVVPDGARNPAATVLGAVATARIKNDAGKNQNIHHNSAFVLDDKLAVQGRFDKTHLVPFGEYVPWPFGGVVKQFIPLGTTTPGMSLEPIDVTVRDQTLRIGPTVCYEGIFPELSRELARNGATFIANLTDDRWYGVSGMATQHLLMYALRSTEIGRPIARATNTGISAWFDTRGRVHKKTEIYTEAVVVDDVPLETSSTLFLALGDWVAMLALLFTLGAWFFAMLGRDVRTRAHSLTAKTFAAAGAVLVVFGLALWLSMALPDEARSTQSLGLVIVGLFASIGALSGRAWGKRAIFVIGIVLVVGGLAGAALGPLWSLVVAVVGALFIAGARKLAPYR